MSVLRRHRMAKGLTLRALGQRIGVSQAACSSWETGRCLPSARVIPKLARALGISPLHLTELLIPAGPALAAAAG